MYGAPFPRRIPPHRPGQENEPVTRGAMLERVRALARPADPLPPLSRRSRVFDAVLALGLLLTAAQAGTGNGDDEARMINCPVPEFGASPVPRCQQVWPPLLPIDDDRQAGWTILLFVLVVLPLVFRRRYPLGVLWAVLALATVVSDDPAALRLSFFACVIAGYSAA